MNGNLTLGCNQVCAVDAPSGLGLASDEGDGRGPKICELDSDGFLVCGCRNPGHRALTNEPASR